MPRRKPLTTARSASQPLASAARYQDPAQFDSCGGGPALLPQSSSRAHARVRARRAPTAGPAREPRQAQRNPTLEGEAPSRSALDLDR